MIIVIIMVITVGIIDVPIGSTVCYIFGFTIDGIGIMIGRIGFVGGIIMIDTMIKLQSNKAPGESNALAPAG
ncbi:hypothetical protein T492DRAFT_1044712 [Pavlovales sp. CCMP2436]|nr:hypothetical protein T492DRAFT_1044712 [Pavlovales sp. CCMP2436]